MCFLPVMRSFALEDKRGIELTVGILLRFLDKGRHQNTLQFDQVKNLRSAYLNCWYTSKVTLTTCVMVRNTRMTDVTSCPLFSLWFEWFIVGIH